MKLGCYQEGTTFFHRLDPRAKMAFSVLFIVAAFCADGVFELVLIVCASLAVLVLSGAGYKEALAALKPFVWFMVVVFVLDVLFSSSGTVLWEAGVLSVSTGGLAFAVTSVVHFVSVLLGSSALAGTTSATQISDAVTWYLQPLRKLGVDVDSAALAVQMTLRFVPLVAEEYDRVREAQEARLADFDSGRFRAKLKALVPTLVPLFVGALRRSETLALAICNREFGAAEKRSCYRTYRMRGSDWAVVAAGVMLFVSCLI